MGEFKLADVARVMFTPQPKKIRKKKVLVMSLSPVEKDKLRSILATRLWHRKNFLSRSGMSVAMRAKDLAGWFVSEHGHEYPGYDVNVIMAVLRDAIETGSVIKRVGHGFYTVSDSYHP